MGRQRNEQTIADIRRAIWGLFVEQGYAKTSFRQLPNARDCNDQLCSTTSQRRKISPQLLTRKYQKRLWQRLMNCILTLINCHVIT